MAVVTATLGPVDERTTRVLTATLQSRTGTVITLAEVSTLTLTYYNVADGSTLNSRDGQNVLNTNNVTLHATSGLLTWTMQPADTAIVDDNLLIERHRALFEWTLTNGEAGKSVIDVTVRNVGRVT